MSKKTKGYTRGLAPSQLRAIRKIFKRKVLKNEIVSLDLAREIFSVAESIGRRIGVLISREGHVEEVFVGNRDILYMPDLGRYRLGAGRLRRLRLVYSDLSKGEGLSIPSDIYADLEKLRLDLVAGVKSFQNRSALSYAYNLPFKSEKDRAVLSEEVPDISRFEFDFLSFISELEAEHATTSSKTIGIGRTQAVLVGVYGGSKLDPKVSIAELEELARTAGIQVVERVIQKRRPDPKTLLGKGKLEEVVLLCLRLGVELLVFDQELTPSQWRIVTNSTELKVIDRSMLILDIFAQRAKSTDGRLQVELAQLKYNLPRLVEKDVGLSRLTGEIGGRGPGETKLEIGRRRSRDRIRKLERKIDKLGSRRRLLRRKRKSGGVPLVSIIGYTNAGKSTLFNVLTKASVIVEDKLFATLDPAQRKFFIPPRGPEKSQGESAPPEEVEGVNIVVADTVGFIRDLPRELWNAFRATLEEVREASILVHVLDGTDRDITLHKKAVDKVIEEMELSEVPRIVVVNKCDLLDNDKTDELKADLHCLTISAVRKTGINLLTEAIRDKLIGVSSNGY